MISRPDSRSRVVDRRADATSARFRKLDEVQISLDDTPGTVTVSTPNWHPRSQTIANSAGVAALRSPAGVQRVQRLGFRVMGMIANSSGRGAPTVLFVTHSVDEAASSPSERSCSLRGRRESSSASDGELTRLEADLVGSDCPI
jgi:hypothetical protein